MPSKYKIPKSDAIRLQKQDILATLSKIDKDEDARNRILNMENAFRDRLQTMTASLPVNESKFDRFGTSPYVLLFYAYERGYTSISQIDGDIVPAKVFSSMETSAGRMLEAVTLPVYGWETVLSVMHSEYSAIDGRNKKGEVCAVATLKSGPRCLNDEMSENFADTVLAHAGKWAEGFNLAKVEFTYGVLYGTPRKSNKKDWHILRNLVKKTKSLGGNVIHHCDNSWFCVIDVRGVEVTATVRIGLDWWTYLGGPTCALEVWTAMIRACILPGNIDDPTHRYQIGDLGQVVSIPPALEGYNVSLLQKSQLPWLFFVARHFCDELY